MDPIDAFNKVWAGANKLKELSAKVKEADFRMAVADLLMDVADLKVKIAELTQENLVLKGRLEKQEDLEMFKSKLKLEHNVYVYVENGQRTLYCPTCLIEKGLKMPVALKAMGIKQCPKCGVL